MCWALVMHPAPLTLCPIWSLQYFDEVNSKTRRLSWQVRWACCACPAVPACCAQLCMRCLVFVFSSCSSANSHSMLTRCGMRPPRCVQFTNGTVHVKANYDKSYELILMPLQAAVLLPFNDSAWRGWLVVLCCMAFGEAG